MQLQPAVRPKTRKREHPVRRRRRIRKVDRHSASQQIGRDSERIVWAL